MRTFVSATVLVAVLFAGCAHGAASHGRYVSLTSADGAPIAGVEPSSLPYTQGGPTATAWLANGAAHTADGRVVSGIMIRAWSESGAARVQVYGMVTRGDGARFTTEEAALEPVELGSYRLRPNQSVAITEMANLGVKPLMLSY